MPWKSRWTVDLPTCSLPTLLFKSPDAPLSDGPVLIDAERPDYYLSQQSYRLWSKRLAVGLRKRGFQPGDRVLLFSGNTIFFPCVIMGAIMAGGIFTGANPAYVAREVAYQLKDSGATFLITSDTSLDTALEAAESINFPRECIFHFDDGYATLDGTAKPINGIQHWSSLLAPADEAESFSWRDCKTREEMNATICLNYSSGTTGVPKGVEITHMNYVANSVQTKFVGALFNDYEARMKHAVALCILPFYHAYGQTIMAITKPMLGVPVYVVRKFDFLKMLEYVQRYRVTSLSLVPPILVAMAKRPEVKDYDLSSIESTECGAAPLGREPIIEYEALWPKGDVNVKQGWGMTEITCSGCGWDPNEWSESAAVGELQPNLEAMIVDEDNREVQQGERGEMWMRGPNVMKGYWGKPEATAATVTPDGWLKTGDVAYLDKAGKIFIVDRMKELIKVKGNQVAPAELEALLLDNPAVADAAVVGVTIKGEELPRAYIVLQADKQASPEEIASWLSTRVAPHKRLTGGVSVVGEIPKNASGKIIRKVLRERAKKEVGDSETRQARL